MPPPATPPPRALDAPPLAAVWALVGVLLAALLLREAASLLVPLLFGGFLALVAWPLVEWLVSRGLGRGIALALTILAVIVVVIGASVLIAVSVAQLVVLVPRYEAQMTALLASAQELLDRFGIPSDVDGLLALVPPEQIAGAIRSVASTISTAGVAILVVILTMAYALVAATSIRDRAERSFGRDHRLVRGVHAFGSDLRRYLVVRAQLGLFAAVLSFGLLLVLGVPLSALWAFLVFAASFVPNIGTLVALVPPTVLALLDGGVAPAVIVLAGYVAINFAQDNFLQPLILGTELNLSPLVVFVAVVVWAWILGAAGALLAVPLTVGLVAILEAFPATREVALLMRAKVDEPVDLAADG